MRRATSVEGVYCSSFTAAFTSCVAVRLIVFAPSKHVKLCLCGPTLMSQLARRMCYEVVRSCSVDRAPSEAIVTEPYPPDGDALIPRTRCPGMRPHQILLLQRQEEVRSDKQHSRGPLRKSKYAFNCCWCHERRPAGAHTHTRTHHTGRSHNQHPPHRLAAPTTHMHARTRAHSHAP